MQTPPTLPPALAAFDLTGRTALVTGSSSGIGFALACGLASAGARLLLNGRDAVRLDQAAQKMQTLGYTATPMVFDVTDPAAAAQAVDGWERDHGPIDILVNNAGMQRRAPLETFALEHWAELMRTNVDSVFYVTQPVARHMIARGRGKIINVCFTNL